MDTLVSVNGEYLTVDDCYIEECEVSTTVYNFQVDDYHTYFVGESMVWVHNKNCTPQNRQDLKDHPSVKVDENGFFTARMLPMTNHSPSDLYTMDSTRRWTPNPPYSSTS